MFITTEPPVKSLPPDHPRIRFGCPYRHIKTGGLYLPMAVIICSDDDTWHVLYRSITDVSLPWFTRDAKAFLERFEETRA